MRWRSSSKRETLNWTMRCREPTWTCLGCPKKRRRNAPPAPATPRAPAAGAPLRVSLPPLPEEINRESMARGASSDIFAAEEPDLAAEAPPVEDGSINLPGFDELETRTPKGPRNPERRARAGFDNDALEDLNARVAANQAPKRKIGDKKALKRAMESDPNADVNFASLERKTDDLVAIALGENAQTFFGIESSYIQLGHTALVLVILLATFAVDPNFPLTNLPVEYRDFLKQGLVSVYAVNTLVAGKAFFEARDRGQPVAVWVTKAWFLGGVGYNQLVTSTRRPGAKGGRKAAKKAPGFSLPVLPKFENPFE